jgi:hypothetical protein
MYRGLLCETPRQSSFRLSKADGKTTTTTTAGGAKPKVETGISSPRDAMKLKHVSFRMTTGEFAGLEGNDDMALFFGAPLTGQPRIAVKGYTDRIPIILVLLAQELDKRNGFTSEGIFRLSTESESLQYSRDVLNVGQGISKIDAKAGPNLCAALIKDWFRSLPQGKSLLQHLRPDQLSQLAKPENIKSETFWGEVLTTDKYIQEPNRSVFTWILDIMAMVCANEAKNRMNERAISIVFAPSLWEAPPEMPPLAAMNAIKDVAGIICASLNYVRKNNKGERKPF